MIPLDSKCYVEGKGVGKVEAICRNSQGAISRSYCVRLSSEPNKIQWFEEERVTPYDEPLRQKSKTTKE